ncbi:hypothetical protein [Bordetella petrii]|uniref:hypothetical protein n=1 Tax=Bordetella petrii TaxID=94624 RepID=UPI001E2EF420|nr:hypothetical protein [Bordetella petrii]MCD0502325.1 hypothetical protein [Bordetella petrii]
MIHIKTLLTYNLEPHARQALLENALEHTHADLAAIRQAIEAGDLAEARQQVHRAKGTVSFLSADRDASRHLDTLTEALRTEDSRRIADACQPVYAILRELEAEVRALLNGTAPGGAKTKNRLVED